MDLDVPSFSETFAVTFLNFLSCTVVKLEIIVLDFLPEVLEEIIHLQIISNFLKIPLFESLQFML